MESKNKDNKQHNHATLFCFLIVLLSLCLLYSTTVATVRTPYKPAANSSSDPILLALHTSVSNLQNISSLPQTLISESKDPQTLHSLRRCEDILKLAETHLNKSISLMNDGPKDNPVFTETLDEWIATAVSQQKFCNGFYLEEKMGWQVVDDEQFGMRLKRLKQRINSSISVVEKRRPLLEKYRFRACLFDYICATI